MSESRSQPKPAADCLRFAVVAVSMTWMTASLSYAQPPSPHRHTIRLSDGRQAHFDEWTIDSENQRITLIRFSNQIEIRREIPLALLTADDRQTFGASTNLTAPPGTTLPPATLTAPAIPRQTVHDPDKPSAAIHTTRRFPLEQLDQLPELPAPRPASSSTDPDLTSVQTPFCAACSTRSVLIGIEPGPLSAYQHLLAPYFPSGIPRSEVPFARTLGQQLIINQAFPPPVPPQRFQLDSSALPPAPASLPPSADPSGPEEYPTLPPEPTVPGSAEFWRPGSRPIAEPAILVTSTTRPGSTDLGCLRVRIEMRDGHGSPRPTTGTVRFTLRGFEQKLLSMGDGTVVGHPQSVRRLATWTRSLSPDSPRNEWLLPLPGGGLEQQWEIADLGQLQVHISLPGISSFDRVLDDVVLRRQSWTSNASLLATGRLFGPGERTSGRPRILPVRPRSLTSLREQPLRSVLVP